MNRPVNIKYVSNLLRVVVAQGYDVQPLLLACGLTSNPLDAVANEHVEVSAELYSKIFQQVSRLLQDECFGFYNDNPIPCGTFRMMCFAVIQCNTLFDAIQRATEFTVMCHNLRGTHQIVHDRIRYERGGEIAVYTDPDLSNSNISKTFSSQRAIASTLSSWHRFCSWLIGAPIELEEVALEGDCQINMKKYQRIFNCGITFNHAENSIKFNSRYLNESINHSQESVEEFLKIAPYQLIALREIEGDLSVVERVRTAIGYNFSRKLPSFSQVASLLNISQRTLRRQLEQAGHSYQQIKDDCRKEAVIAYLERPELTVNAIAALMGFEEPSAFHRAFKKWAGMPPGKYRELHWGRE